MAIESPGDAAFTRTMDPVGVDYFDWNPPGSPISIHMHLSAMEGIAQDVVEGFGNLPRRGLEVGGLLLGRVLGGSRPTAWIERYQPIECSHRFGPQFILDGYDTAALEDAAARILEGGEVSVVGFYRSHTRPGFQLESSDHDLIRRYFSDPSDLVLLIKPVTLSNVSGQFFAWDAVNGAQPAGDEFPFGVQVATSRTRPAPPDPPVIINKELPPEKEVPIQKEPEASVEERTEPSAVAPERPRRLVPDFPPSPGLGPRPLPDHLRWAAELPPERETRERFTKWLPPIAALLLVAGLLWYLLKPAGRVFPITPPAGTAETARPLGLYVDPLGQTWHVMWNPNATALREARSVQLFVREGDDLNRIDLPAPDLIAGSHDYRPAGNDVTFRLEVVDRGGQVSAESFRLLRSPSPDSAPLASTPAAPPPAAAPNAPPARAGGARQITQPKAIYKAPPVVAAGIRPRINGKIPIDVRVTIDTKGHVMMATPVVKPHSGLDEYLATRAVQAARLWRFEPARENGRAVQGTQTIHFVFEK
jgi:hypothetical protein